MALVVTAPAPVETRARPAQAPASRPRLARPLKWITLVSATWYGISLVAESVARQALPWDAQTAAIEALAVSALLATLGVGVVTWLVRRDDAATLLVTTMAVVLAAIRAISTPLLVALELPTAADVAALALALLALGCLVWTATLADRQSAPRSLIAGAEAELFRRVVDVTALFVFAVGLTGVTVRAVGASWACQGTFPDCNGLGVLPFGRDPLADIQLYHRLLAYVALALVAWVTIEAFRSQQRLAGVGPASLVLLGGTLAQGALGAVSVSIDNPPLMQVLHLAGAAATWSAVVVLAALVHRPRVRPEFPHTPTLGRDLPLTPPLSPPGERESLLAPSADDAVPPRPWRGEA